MGEECVFCGIVAGTEPAEVILETEDAVAFLDVAPITEGHTLIVPREHRVDLFDIGEDLAASLMRTTVEVAEILKTSLAPEGMNILHATGAVAWQTVPHFHFHVIPRYSLDELKPPVDLFRSPAPPATLTTVAERIRAVALG